MNFFFMIAAFLLISLGLIHSILGEKWILIPLMKRDLPKLLGSDFLMKRTLRFAWHITTISFWGMAGIVFFCALQSDVQTLAPVLHVITLTNILCGLISLTVAYGRHFSWWVFFLISACIWWGLKPH